MDGTPTFDLESRRHIGLGGVRYKASPDLTLHATVQSTNREGELVLGGSFGHSVLVEMPAPIRHTTVDVDGGAEFENGRFLARGGYTGIVLPQRRDVARVRQSVPRATRCQRNLLARPPRARAQQLVRFRERPGVRGAGAPHRATASFTLGSLKSASETNILPHTVNAALPVVPLERSTVDGEADTASVNLRLTSRPARAVDFNVQYRMYDYDNRTPEFVITQRVAYDNTVSNLTTPKHTEPFGVLRHTFDADARVMPGAGTSAGIGYTHLLEERTHRIFESTREDIVRVIFDVPSHPLFSLRTKYEHGQKRGEGDAQEIAAELLVVGEQPGMRHFDIASRDRNRVTLLGSVIPTSTVSLTASAAFGKDDYKDSHFGLRDNSHRVYSVGLDAVPTDRVSYGGSYQYERYKALSASRQASSNAEFIDPRRDWSTDANDTVHSIVLNGRVLKLRETIDVDFSYDYNRARATYKYITGQVSNPTLPEVPDVPSTLPPPSQLPPVKSDLQRAVFNLTYHLGPRIGIGLSYWFEDYKVEDFTLDLQANPELARGQTLLLGYLYEPYTAHTVWGRVFYRW